MVYRKVILDGIGLTANSIASTINIGTSENSFCGLSASSLSSNFITISDISNNGVIGFKSTISDIIVINILNDAINAGSIQLEITLKNTNYGTYNSY